MKEKKELLKALADFQDAIPIIHQATKGYNYTYTGLPQIITEIKPLLKKFGLGFTQLGTGTGIKTIVFHVKTGQSIAGEFEIPQGVKLGGMNDFQVLGSAITYLRRYSLSSMLGLVTDKDIDAAGSKPVIGKPEVIQPIKPPAAVEVPNEKKIKGATLTLKGSKTMEELQKNFSAMSPAMKKLVESVKDEMKEKLTPQTEKE